MSARPDILQVACKLASAHDTITRFMGDKWPVHRDHWQAIIRAKAKQENKPDLAAAIELAKDAHEPMQSLVILAAACEMPNP